MQKMGHHGLAG